jgi:hypothetical protein
MSKYVEIPQKPAVIQAIQYIGVEDGVPLFNEPVPNWIVGALAKDNLKLIGEEMYLYGDIVSIGSWIVEENDGLLRSFMFDFFVSRYRPARKKPATKKSKDV